MRPLFASGREFVAAAALLMLAACAGTDKPKPAPLEPIAAPIAARSLWQHRQGSVRFPLEVVAVNGAFVLAGDDGSVLALAADSGRELWSVSGLGPLAAGVGSDGRFSAVVTRDNELLVLEQAKVLWRERLGSRVATAPLVAGERVFVMGVDRIVHAYDALDGKKLWTLQRPGDSLTLSQPSVLAAFKDTLLAGQGPRLVGVDPLRGSVRFEAALAAPRGTNEVERLADLIGPAARVGDTVCTRAFQAAVGCVNAERGSLLWAKNFGGTDSVAADEEFTFAADASDRLGAWRTASGEVAWTSEKLLYRALSGPAIAGKSVVYADGQGLVHFLARDSGEPLLRLETDGSPVLTTPVVSAGTILVVTRKGGVFAFRLE